MEMKSVPCPVCGGSEYYKDSGFYFCTECQTQSQELHEQVYEYSFTGIANTSTRVLKKSCNTEKEKSDGTDEWTSWEYYNFILKGLVDELIGLGANRALKIVVLQLWATYLKKLEVAFTSVTKTNIPKLGINYHPRDAKVLYGYVVKEKKRSKKKAPKRSISEISVATFSVNFSDSDPNFAKRRLRKTKKILVEEDYGKRAESSVDVMSEFNESMRSLETSSRGQVMSDHETVPDCPRLEFSSAACQLRSELYKKRDLSSGKASSSSKRISSCKVLKSTNPKIISRIKLLAILHIALRILQENIYLSDLLRWVEEGELSFYEITHFLPQDVKLKGHDLMTFGLSSKRPSYIGISTTAKELAVYLEATRMPTPDLLSLARRYIDELQLPAEIGKYVECIMGILPPPLEFNRPLKHFPNYEGRAMAFIIFILKLLLGLDGKTEYEISKVTRKLNELSGKSAAMTRLFVWEEWVQYIECRKSVLARFHFPTQATHHQGEFSDPGCYVRFWERMKAKDYKRHERLQFGKISKINPDFVSAMKHVFLKLLEEDTGDDHTVNFVPSLTPQKANLKAIFASQPSVFKCVAPEIPSSADILKQDFTKTTLQHLIKPEQYIAMAHDKGIKIIVQKRSAQNQVRQVHKMKKEFESRWDRIYEIVDSEKKVPCSSHGEKKKRTSRSEMSSKKHGVLPDTSSCTDRFFQRSRTFGHLPLVAEHMLLNHLKNNGVPLSSNNYGAGVSWVDSSDENSGSSRSTENEGILKRHSKENDVSSKLDSHMFHKSKKVDQPVHLKKVLLKCSKKRNFKLSAVGESKEYVLYLPYVEYWLNEVSTKVQAFEEFERKVVIQFPPSFRWLLTECARMLQMTIQDLYYELLDVELAYCH
ncbi:TATA box-binding protein-associated factor RNA polymerase I subunit B isoform X2 [Zootermopsis nevadensis]|uniref:TATA box-binding protein-associated factor RNA polymerase I subunit B isoform X2 n=1 Tax=Zootermopsis nevadensis TaxID=136037 RepID=UPI000B8EA13B|nr:TATA box-binding protein-associated factor RNA polymerase I subunit B isoform X2 [Zootermopsis nevadensis]